MIQINQIYNYVKQKELLNKKNKKFKKMLKTKILNKNQILEFLMKC